MLVLKTIVEMFTIKLFEVTLRKFNSHLQYYKIKLNVFINHKPPVAKRDGSVPITPERAGQTF